MANSVLCDESHESLPSLMLLFIVSCHSGINISERQRLNSTHMVVINITGIYCHIHILVM